MRKFIIITQQGYGTMAEVELIIRRNGSTLVKGEVVLKDRTGT